MQNDAFLEILYHTDGTEEALNKGDGMCENLRPYAKVSQAECNGDIDLSTLEGAAYDEFLKRLKAAKSSSERDWKDDYLAYCIYVRAGATQAFAAGLCGISEVQMSKILSKWVHVLDDAL